MECHGKRKCTCKWIFNVHLHFVKFDFDQTMLRYLPKLETSFDTFSGVNSLLYKTLVLGWDDLCSSNKNLFFEGFEFNEPFLVEKTNDLSLLLPASTAIFPKKALNKFLGQVVRKLGL